MNPETIIIETTNPKTGKPQFWEVLPKDYNLIPAEKLFASGRSEPYFYHLDEAVKAMRKLRLCQLYLVPLSIESKDEPVKSRLQYRGYENDVNPFVIRGQRIPEIEACVSDMGDHIYISFRNPSYGDSLTPGQRKWFEENFGEQIAKQITPALLKRVKKAWERYIVAYAKKDCDQLIAQLRGIKKYKAPEA